MCPLLETHFYSTRYRLLGASRDVITTYCTLYSNTPKRQKDFDIFGL